VDRRGRVVDPTPAVGGDVRVPRREGRRHDVRGFDREALELAREDPAYEDVDWKSAVLWTVSAGAVAALTQMMARRGAGAVWKRVTGQTPPRTRRRKRLRSARAAVFG